MSRPSTPWKLVFACSLLAIAASTVHAQEPRTINWRKDYNSARREAEAKNLPMLIDFITTSCLYCDKMDALTFSDPRIIGTINQRFVPLKIHTNDERKLVDLLSIDRYPTTVIAAPDGLILQKKIGFLDADQMQEVMQQTLATLTPADATVDKYKAAVKLEADGEYLRAISSLRDILEDGKPRPLHKDAQELLKKIERRGEERLARAKEMMDKGQKGEAFEAITEITRIFGGLQVSRDASELLVKEVKARPEEAGVQRNKRARDLLVQAHEFYKAKEYIPCMDRCALILNKYGDLPEGTQAHSLAAEIKNNPDWLQNAADVMTDRLGDLWLAIADSHLKRGEVRLAQTYLQRVVTAFPGSRMAESAQIRLNQLQGTIPAQMAVPTNALGARP